MSPAAILAALALALPSSAALCQSVDRAEFTRGLQGLIEASKDGFRAARGEEASKDGKGSPGTYRSKISIKGAEVVIQERFATIRVGRFTDMPAARNAYQETVKLVRASLPEADWKAAGDAIKKTASGVEFGRADFARAKEPVNPRVWVNYTASATTGLVAVYVDNRPQAPKPEAKKPAKN